MYIYPNYTFYINKHQSIKNNINKSLQPEIRNIKALNLS